MLYLVEARGTTTTGARAPVSAAPRRRRHVALLPPKDVAEKDKEEDKDGEEGEPKEN